MGNGKVICISFAEMQVIRTLQFKYEKMENTDLWVCGLSVDLAGLC